MKRRGQLLSIDALLSLVIVVMVVGVVMNTNDMIKAEITNLLDWYDRANIANNMLDVLTKNPGYPEDWEENVSSVKSVKMVGLRDNTYSFALDYDKIIALNRSKDNLTEIFNQLAREKDFLLEVYISNITLNISGRFPRVYLNNITFANPREHPPGVRFWIATGPEEENPSPFIVSYIKVIQDGTTYVNNETCGTPPVNGNVIFLDQGDYVKFVVVQDVYIKAERGKYNEAVFIPNGSVIEFFMTNPQSAFHITYDEDGCPYKFKFAGFGDVVVTVSAYDSTFPTLNFTYESARNLFDLDKPLCRIAMINGTFESNMDKIKSSMNRSPWVEPVYRVSPVTKFIYNLSSGPSREEPILSIRE